MYEGDDGPTETPVEIPKAAVVLSVTGYDADRVVGMVAEKLAEQADEHLRAAIEAKVTAEVERVCVAVCQERVQQELERVLAEGWTETDNYGSPKGTKKTLRDRIGDLLNYKDQYNSQRRWLDELVSNSVKASLGKDFLAEVEIAKMNFRKQVDELLSGNIAKGLRDAFGLRS